MQIKVLIFGQLTDIFKKSDLVIEGQITDTDSLVKNLIDRYPALADSKYAIALNKKVIKENTLVEEDSIIALLPPFSGG